MSNPNPPETTVVPQETRLIPLRLLRQDDANAVSWRGGRTGTGVNALRGPLLDSSGELQLKVEKQCEGRRERPARETFGRRRDRRPQRTRRRAAIRAQASPGIEAG